MTDLALVDPVSHRVASLAEIAEEHADAAFLACAGTLAEQSDDDAQGAAWSAMRASGAMFASRLLAVCRSEGMAEATVQEAARTGCRIFADQFMTQANDWRRGGRA